MEWISVKEQLPKIKKLVLVYSEGQVYMGYRHSQEVDEFWTEKSFCCQGSIYEPTHWMPLPEKPKID